jgi:hypothetical protein
VRFIGVAEWPVPWCRASGATRIKAMAHTTRAGGLGTHHAARDASACRAWRVDLARSQHRRVGNSRIRRVGSNEPRAHSVTTRAVNVRPIPVLLNPNAGGAIAAALRL